jgi:hypothetical protein
MALTALRGYYGYQLFVWMYGFFLRNERDSNAGFSICEHSKAELLVIEISTPNFS